MPAAQIPVPGGSNPTCMPAPLANIQNPTLQRRGKACRSLQMACRSLQMASHRLLQLFPCRRMSGQNASTDRQTARVAELKLQVVRLTARLEYTEQAKADLVAELAKVKGQLDKCQDDCAELEILVRHLKRQHGSSAGSSNDAEAPAAASALPQVPAVAGEQRQAAAVPDQAAGRAGEELVASASTAAVATILPEQDLGAELPARLAGTSGRMLAVWMCTSKEEAAAAASTRLTCSTLHLLLQQHTLSTVAHMARPRRRQRVLGPCTLARWWTGGEWQS